MDKIIFYRGFTIVIKYIRKSINLHKICIDRWSIVGVYGNSYFCNCNLQNADTKMFNSSIRYEFLIVK